MLFLFPIFINRWRAHMILKPIPSDERPILKLKVLAADALKGRRKDWGSGRKWEANYIVINDFQSYILQYYYHIKSI